MHELRDFKSDEITKIKVDKNIKIIDQSDRILKYNENPDKLLNYYDFSDLINLSYVDNDEEDHIGYYLDGKMIAIQITLT